ncbi:hypothetical protein [Qipengyuania oceanensis]|uniref:Uncharacterized protein n=1 Tax=Qipengyuania oceanensis TaxID=1463597 RepID=A0A844YIU2_9SPHN|nr:hypothetical protein [Qipengyuania oceanensis]MXO63857.1 hypothetical protein [Qipengyuania oceanensis]
MAELPLLLIDGDRENGICEDGQFGHLSAKFALGRAPPWSSEQDTRSK